MVGPVRLFQNLREYYQTMGIYLPNSSIRRHYLNQRNSFFLTCYTQLLITSMLFLLFEAETTLEFGAALYAVLAESFCIWYFLIKMYKMPKILQLIDKFDAFMEKSKRIQWFWVKFCDWFLFPFSPNMQILLGAHGTIMYYELIEKIERLSEITYLILVKISILGIFQPYINITIVNYFMLDMKNESFYLPYPVM